METTMPTQPNTLARRRARSLALEDLENWDSTLADLNAALAQAAIARDKLTGAQAELDLTEARLTLDIEGRNEAERRARLTIALSESEPAQKLTAIIREQRLRLADCERRIELARQRARLLRAAVAIAMGTTDAEAA